MPITNTSRPTDEPYNKLKNSQILMKALVGVEPDTIVVFDSFYLTLEALELLKRRKQRFVGKCNPEWWKDLVAQAKQEISDEDGDFVLLYSEEHELHFMMMNCGFKKKKKKTKHKKRKVIKRKYVLTNAFINVDPLTKNYPGQNTISTMNTSMIVILSTTKYVTWSSLTR